MSESGAQHRLCMEVLRRLHEAGVLEQVVEAGDTLRIVGICVCT